MCLSASYMLHRNSTVSSAAQQDFVLLGTSARGIFSLHNAVRSTNFGCTGRLHYFSAVHKVRAHALYMDVIAHSPDSGLKLFK